MALIYNGILKKWQDMAGKWRVQVDLTDETIILKFPNNPTDGQVEAEANKYIAGRDNEAEFAGNEMNLPRDEEYILEHMRNIKRAIILRIREYPNATLAQAQAYIDATFPNDVINFTILYQKYLNLLNLANWAAFKTFVITHKFRGID